MFSPRNLQIASYDYDSEDTFSGTDLRVWNYDAPWSADGNYVGFAFDQDFYEYPADWNPATNDASSSSSLNRITVQPDSGFTAQV